MDKLKIYLKEQDVKNKINKWRF